MKISSASRKPLSTKKAAPKVKKPKAKAQEKKYIAPKLPASTFTPISYGGEGGGGGGYTYTPVTYGGGVSYGGE